MDVAAFLALTLAHANFRRRGGFLRRNGGRGFLFGGLVLDNLDPLKTPVTVAMVGRADPDVIKSGFYPKNRDWLLQKGGISDKVQSFVDDHLNQLLEAIASEPDQQKRLAISGEIQTWVLDQAYQIPIFEEPQAFAAAPYVKGLAFEAVGRPSFYNVWLAAH